MIASQFYIIYIVYTLIFLLVLFTRSRFISLKPPKGGRELPGPPGYPIIGNLLDLPKKYAWVRFKELGDIYGPIFKLKILGNTFVIVNSTEIAEQLLSVRGAYYSDRSNFPMLSMMTNGGDLVIRPFDSYWKRGRKFATAMLNATAVKQWQPIQAREAQRMVVDMIREPENYQLWLERFATAVSIRAGFGKDINAPQEGEYHTNIIMNRMHELERVAVVGSYIVNILPFLIHLPTWIAPFKQEAKRHYAHESAYFYGLFQEAEERYKANIPENPPSFARCWHEKADHYELNWKEAGYVLATIYGGGSGTTSSTMQTYCLAMCLYPEWQKRLHDEVESAVGINRVPTFDDCVNLPIVRAVAKELLRWRPIVSQGVPHRLIQDDVYNGYHIPKGALVFANQWGMHRDKNKYPDGENFRPERWLDPKFTATYKEPNGETPNIRRYSAFGAGRRICPGYEIAEQALYIQIASLAWACHITKKVTNGKEVPVPFYDYSNGGNTCPNAFQFQLRAYDDRREILMQKAWQAAC